MIYFNGGNMKKGFTLIELLAVIVILAIIALIAVPIVLNIISDAKKSSEKESIKLYLDTVEKTIAKRQLASPNFNPTKCDINEDRTVTCGGETIKIEIKGDIPKSGTIKFEKGMIISGVNIELNHLYYQVPNQQVIEGTKKKKIIYSDYITLVNDADHNEKVSHGDEYTYKVNDTDTFPFYVLSIEGDKVNLIMDRNICEDGSVEYTSTNNYCRYAWHKDTIHINNYGPNTAMTILYNATKTWNNVPDMIINYIDENNKNIETIGYAGIQTNFNTKITTIIGKNGAENSLIGTSSEPLKSRLAEEQEVKQNGCGPGFGLCPIWLVENMRYFDTTSKISFDKYSMNNNNDAYQNINGYWLLSSYQNNINKSKNVEYYVGISTSSTGYAANFNLYGIRSVITVSKDDLS